MQLDFFHSIKLKLDATFTVLKCLKNTPNSRGRYITTQTLHTSLTVEKIHFYYIANIRGVLRKVKSVQERSFFCF